MPTVALIPEDELTDRNLAAAEQILARKDRSSRSRMPASSSRTSTPARSSCPRTSPNWIRSC
jgi:hypothetical protein